MKIRSRILSIAITTCMVASVFSLAPGVFAAELQDQNTGDQTKVYEDTTQTEPGSSEPVTNSKAKTAAPAESDTAYQITTQASPENGGTVTVDKPSAVNGDAVTYTVVPAAGYKTTAISIGEVAVNVTDPYTKTTGIFSAEGETKVSAKFTKLASYKITTSVNSTARGSITATSSVTENGTKTITAKAKSGYYLSDLQVDGKSVGEKYTYKFTGVKASHTVKAVFSKQIKVMLDAGHYGKYNRSPVYSSYYESNMSWALHNYLKDALEDYNGFYVGTTRSNQAKDMNVYYRGTAAKGYDLFLSLHSNSSSSKTSDYPLIITQKGRTGSSLAKNLGKTIQNTMKTKQAYDVWQKLNSDGQTEYYGVLRGSKAVGTEGMILEHSFHTNLAATKWLSNNSNLKKMAQAEAKVIADHYDLTLKDGASSGNNDDGDKDDTTTKPTTPEKPTTPTKPVVSSTQKVKVTVSSLNIRKSYSSSSQRMGIAKKGTIYQLKAKTKDGLWGQLKTNGYWIYLKGYTSVVNSSTPSDKPSSSSKTVASSQKVKITVSSLNMRKSYSTSSQSMGKVKKGLIYQLKAKTKDGLWGQLKTNGYWIYLKGYTSVVNSSTPSDKPSSSSKTVASSQKVKITVSSLNMRKSYSTGSKSMGKVRKNAIYQLKAKTKNGLWGQLKTNGYWIYLKGYTSVVNSSTTSSKPSSTSKTVTSSQKVKITVSSLNMRKSYSTGSKSMGKVKKNKIYQLKAKTKDGKWGQLKTNSYWIYLKGYTKAV